jgi:hypothetical protein
MLPDFVTTTDGDTYCFGPGNGLGYRELPADKAEYLLNARWQASRAESANPPEAIRDWGSGMAIHNLDSVTQISPGSLAVFGIKVSPP